MLKNKAKEIKSKMLSSRLLKDSIWSLLGSVIGRGLTLVAGIIVARFLGKDLFGEYGMIRNTILTIGIFSTFGLGYTATKYVAEYKNRQQEMIPIFNRYAIRITLIFSGFMALLLFAFADYLAFGILEAGHLAMPLRILSVLIIFNGLTTTQTGIIAGLGDFKELAKINSYVGGITFLSSVALTYYFSLEGALLALLLAQVINWGMNYQLLIKKTRTFKEGKNQLDKSFYKKILQFSTPIALREGIYSMSSWLISLSIISFTNYGELGLYSAATQWNAIVLFIPGILNNVVLSHLSFNSKELNKFNSIVNRIIFVNFTSTFTIIIFVLIFSRFIENTYGKSFEGLSLLISISVFCSLFISISGVLVQSFISMGKNWLMLYLSIFREFGILFLGILLIFFETFDGAKAIIVSSLIFNFLYFLTTYIIYKLLIKKKI